MVGENSSLRIGLVTCRELPEPDVDEPLQLEALRSRGASPVMVAWDDPAVDWGALDLAVIRSTWNYHLHREEFLAWIERASAKTKLLNPPEILRWNSHKTYLADLKVPVVPTEFLARGASMTLASLLDRRGWDRVVLKPTVSGGSFDTHRVDRATLAEGEQILGRMLAEREVMVQPYIRSVEAYGERSMIIIDGELTHAIRKTPRFSGGHENVSASQPVADDERALAMSIWSSLPAGLLYGRIDLARDDRGAPMVMELELLEPSLFFLQNPSALTRFADATIRAARR